MGIRRIVRRLVLWAVPEAAASGGAVRPGDVAVITAQELRNDPRAQEWLRQVNQADTPKRHQTFTEAEIAEAKASDEGFYNFLKEVNRRFK